MHVLFVDEVTSHPQGTASELESVLNQQPGPLMITQFRNLQAAIEFLEQTHQVIDLIIIGYESTSTIMIKALLSAIKSSPVLIFSDEKLNKELIARSGKNVTVIKRIMGVTQIPEALSTLKNDRAHLYNHKDADFLGLPSDGLMSEGYLPSDVYIRLAEDRYCKIFKKGTELLTSDLDLLVQHRGINILYTPKSTFNPKLLDQQKKLDNLPEPFDANREKVRETIEETVELIHDVVTQSGFTPESQALSKKVVEVTLKMMGTKPELNDIVKRIRAHEGKYISSHSIMLAEICCALAFRIGWTSASTFLKLTLASFVHDLPITDQKLARMQSISGAEKAFSPEDVQQFKFHPMRAAEYVQKFTDIPPDVDTIVQQHHERPDGTGFPRGLFGQQISPLAALFIISQDLMNEIFDKGTAQIVEYVTARAELYGSGAFKKIVKSLQTDQKIGE